MAKSKGGRPSKLDAVISKAIIEAITAGLTYTHACEIVGVSYNTFNEWRKKGKEQKEGEYREFHEALTRAEHQASLSMMATVRKVAQGYKMKQQFVSKEGEVVSYEESVPADWRAAAWWLERRYPGEYGKQRIEHTGVDGGPIIIKTGMSMDDL